MNTAQRRRSITAFVAAGAIAVTLAACSPEETATPEPGSEDTENRDDDEDAEGEDESSATPINVDDYNDVVDNGPVAEDSVVEANEWASAVKEAGVLEVGGTETSELFSLLSPDDGVARGFDAGLSQMLSLYILGEVNTNLSQITVETREEVLENGTVDAVFATYSITEERAARVDFAGPYFDQQAAILVPADNTDINGVDDLDGKTVATQSASTGVTALEEFAPGADILELPDHAQALSAVQQGRADAYVIDYGLLLNAVVSNDDVKIVGDQFGEADYYGIGLPKDSDALEFVNTWLQEVEDSGSWEQLWQVTLGDRTGETDTPEPPAIGEVDFN